MRFIQTYKGDICGGLSAAFVSLPWNIVYGLMAFSVFGAAYSSAGIAAGFYCSIIVGGIAVLLGGDKAIITGPKATTTILFMSVIADLTASLGGAAPPSVEIILTLAFLVIFLSGIFQIIFGLLRFGDLIKYIPYPVIAGFMNGAALIIILQQMWDLLGVKKTGGLLSLTGQMHAVKPGNIAAGFAIIITYFLITRFVKKLNGVLCGLIAGLIVFHALRLSGFSHLLGDTLGSIQPVIPSPSYAVHFFNLLRESIPAAVYLSLIPSAFGLAVLGSLNTMLSASSIQNMGGCTVNTNREFIALGAANIAGSFFGTLPGSGTISPQAASFQSGGRGRLSGIVYCAALLLIFFIIMPVAGMIPKAVIAAMLFVVAFRMMDRWSLGLFVKLFQNGVKQKKKIFALLLNVLLVTVITVAFNLAAAVLLGILISFFLFIRKMSRSIVRRTYSGDSHHSNRQRGDALMHALRENGKAITVIELEGSAFFGSIGSLMTQIDGLTGKGTRFIILDIRRIHEIESTGAKYLEQICGRLKREERELVFSHVRPDIWRFVKNSGFFEHNSVKLFADTDIALEYCENRLLYDILKLPPENKSCELAAFSIFSGFRECEIFIFEKYLTKRTYDKGEIIIRQGDDGDAMFFITKGAANVTLDIAETSRKKRLQTFTAGTIFGEFSLLDRKPRAATVSAKDTLECSILDVQSFVRLREEEPGICFNFLANVSRLLVTRIRNSDRMIEELER